MRAAVVRSLLPALMLLCGVIGPVQAQNCALRDANLKGRYEGDCLRGWANGQGRATGKDQYEGAFMDGHAHGRGVYTFADGTRFDGLFVNGRVQGMARFHYAGGDVLEGEFRNNRLQGVGRLVKPAGEVLLVELRGATLMPVPVQPPVQAAAAPGGSSATGGSTSALPTASGPAQGWEPRLDFEDLFPSFILANAARKPAAASRSAPAGWRVPRADPLATADPGGLVASLGLPAVAGATTRWTGSAPDALYLGDPWGLVGIRLRNETPGTKVTVRVTLDDYAETTETEFTLPGPGLYALYPQMRYRFDRLLSVTQPVPVKLQWQVWINGQPAGSHSGVARMRSVQDAPFFVRTKRGMENTSLTFAAFVTEDAPWIDVLLKEAFAGTGQVPMGYQGGADAVDEQVAIIFNHLKRRGVIYSSITTTSAASDNVISQVVRFPSDSVRTAQANCVDGTVLMASILRKIDIEPIIITGPGHAMLGYYRQRPGGDRKPDFLVVETTMIANASFPEAVKRGVTTYRKWATENRDHPMFNSIPIHLAREAGVMPIAR